VWECCAPEHQHALLHVTALDCWMKATWFAGHWLVRLKLCSSTAVCATWCCSCIRGRHIWGLESFVNKGWWSRLRASPSHFSSQAVLSDWSGRCHILLTFDYGEQALEACCLWACLWDCTVADLAYFFQLSIFDTYQSRIWPNSRDVCNDNMLPVDNWTCSVQQQGSPSCTCGQLVPSLQ